MIMSSIARSLMYIRRQYTRTLTMTKISRPDHSVVRGMYVVNLGEREGVEKPSADGNQKLTRKLVALTGGYEW